MDASDVGFGRKPRLLRPVSQALVMSSYHAIVAIFARSITTCRPIPREGPIIKATGFPIVDQVLQGLRLCGHLEYAVEATWKGAQLGSLRPVNERTEAQVSPK